MLEIFKNLPEFGDNKVRTAISQLYILEEEAYYPDAMDEKPEPEELLEAAVSNLNFIHEDIAPIISEIYVPKGIMVEFKPKSIWEDLRHLEGNYLIFNAPAAPGRVSYPLDRINNPFVIATSSVLAGIREKFAFDYFAHLSYREIVNRFRDPLIDIDASVK